MSSPKFEHVGITQLPSVLQTLPSEHPHTWQFSVRIPLLQEFGFLSEHRGEWYPCGGQGCDMMQRADYSENFEERPRAFLG